MGTTRPRRENLVYDPFFDERPNTTNNSTGKDEFVTNKTGYAGSIVMRVGFQAPSLVYYESDYTEVCRMA